MAFRLADFLRNGSIMSCPAGICMGWGITNYTTYEGLDRKKPSFYFPDFFLQNPTPWIQHSEWCTITQEECLSLLNKQNKTFFHSYTWEINHSEKFKFLFDQILEEFSKGNLQKAVPYLFAHSQKNMSYSQLCRSLTTCLHYLKESQGYLYGHWNAQRGVVGLTPELLFSHSIKNPFLVNTMALAGTCALGEEASFIESEKDHKEHQFVIQGIQQTVKKIGKITLGKKQLMRLPTLFHLMTPIAIQLKETFHFDTTVRTLHPTPALGAFPLERQWEWLQQYQNHFPRFHYGAPIGYVDHAGGFSQCVVGIRNIQWNATGMHIAAGCGVVQESVFEKEWKEIQLKIYSIRKQLAV